MVNFPSLYTLRKDNFKLNPEAKFNLFSNHIIGGSVTIVIVKILYVYCGIKQMTNYVGVREKWIFTQGKQYKNK